MSFHAFLQKWSLNSLLLPHRSDFFFFKYDESLFIYHCFAFFFPHIPQNFGAPAEWGHGYTQTEVVAQRQPLWSLQFSPDTAAQQRPGYPQLCRRLLRPSSRRSALLPHRHGGKLVVSEEGVQSSLQGGKEMAGRYNEVRRGSRGPAMHSSLSLMWRFGFNG